MEEAVDLHQEAGNENEQTWANCWTTSRSRLSAKLPCRAKRSQKFEKPRQLPFSLSETMVRNVCYPESWARYIRSVRRKPSRYLHYNTAKCLHSEQIQPQAIFAGAHIDKFEGCTFNINVFCGDQSKIPRVNENWSLSDRGTNRHYLQLYFWSLSCFVISTTSFFIEPVWKIFVFIHWRSLYRIS